MPDQPRIRIKQLFISPGHNYFGHHGKQPSAHPMLEKNSVRCVAGRGIEGDRFLDYKDDYKGQITFFSHFAAPQVQQQQSHHDDIPQSGAGYQNRLRLISRTI